MPPSAATRRDPPPGVVASGPSYPLSDAQQRLWFLAQLMPECPVYHVPLGLRITGALNLDALEIGLAALVQRHPALRTGFQAHDGQPVQVVAPQAHLTLGHTDLRGVSAGELREEELRRRAVAEARRPFDLAIPPLARAHVYTVGDTDQILLLTLHHLIFDGWSRSVLLNDLATLYVAALAHQTISQEPMRLDLVVEALWDDGTRVAQQREHLVTWRTHLEDAPTVFELPTDFPRPLTQSFAGARQAFHLPLDLLQRLKALGRHEHTSLFMVLLTAFETLLYRYTQQETFLIGTPIANRPRAEVEDVIGFFVNTLALRADLAGNPSCRELLGRVRDECLDAYTHMDVPFQGLVDALAPERTLSHTPLLQVLCALQNAPHAMPHMANLTLEPWEIDLGVARFDITLELTEGTAGLDGTIEYSTDLFAAPTIARMAQHYRCLLEGLVADPDQRIAEMNLLPAAERQQLVAEWSTTRRSADLADNASAIVMADACFPQRFEAQVARTPDALAALYADQSMTYHALNTRANQLAHALRALGSPPEGRIALCIDRSLDLLVGMLGIWKAGGIYVPIDPQYPAERVAYMLDDAAVQVVLTQAALLPRFSSHTTRTVIALDAADDLLAQQACANPLPVAQSAHVAYVIYTSGSTGRPKGVMLTHGGLSNLTAAQAEVFALAPSDRVVQFASISFDASIFEVALALLAGATLVLAPEAVLHSGPGLLDLLRDQAITVATLPPSLLAGLAEASGDTQTRFPRLQTLVVAGEACPPEVVMQWAPGRRMFNAYGPTETTVWATVARCRPDGRRPPIGRPIRNAAVYVLDGHQQLLPVGIPGELSIGGAGVACGYLHRPELTADRFVPDPFSADPTARLYLTGDRVRYLPSGDLEFLGRVDHQVKLRGFRIELGEIETVLAGHPGVHEVVVIVRDDLPGHPRLVGYVVPATADNVSPAALRALAREKLPEYMVPSAFILLDAIPLTANGKVALSQLPLPEPERAIPRAPDDREEAPQTATERLLAAIWEDVLRIERVDRRDNFFELGGDSLLCMRVVARAAQVGLRLSVQDIFRAPTLAGLAGRCTAPGTDPRNAELIATPAATAAVQGAIPLIPSQHRAFEFDVANRQQWNMAFLFEVQEMLDPVVWEAAVGVIERHHDALRLRFVQDATGWQQQVATPGEAHPFRAIDLSRVPEAERATAIEQVMTQLQTSLDLAHGPLFRVAFMTVIPGTIGRLAIVLHHLVADALSAAIVLDDLYTAYHLMADHQAAVLPAQTTSFAHWAEQLQAFARAALEGEEAAYWLQQAAQRPVWPLPVDMAAGERTVASAHVAWVTLSELETAALQHPMGSATAAAVIRNALLASLVWVVAEWTGKTALWVDLTDHGRHPLAADMDVSRTVGFFAAHAPVWLTLDGTSDPRSLLESVNATIQHIPHAGLGFGALRYMTGHRDVAEQLGVLRPEVRLNYMGDYDRTFLALPLLRPAQESVGPTADAHNRLRYPLELFARIQHGCLEVGWRGSQHQYRPDTLTHLAQAYAEKLRLYARLLAR